jgi:hypothetical protein
VVAAVGFVPCEDKHRVKEALWQRFVQNLTLTRASCSDSVLHLMLVGRAPMDRGTLHGVCNRRRARSAAPYLRYIARERFLQMFQPLRKRRFNDQRDECRRASAISNARRAVSSSARSSSYEEKRCFGSGAIIRCKTRAVGPDTFGAIVRNSDGCFFSAYNSVAEFVLLSIGAFPAAA